MPESVLFRLDVVELLEDELLFELSPVDSRPLVVVAGLPIELTARSGTP